MPVTRDSFPEVLAHLAGRFEVDDDQADTPSAPVELRARLADTTPATAPPSRLGEEGK